MFKPATPGFLTTLGGTILLAVVSFSVPWFKTIYFLKASINDSGQSGFITFGTLGYCLTLNGQQTCSKPAIGYNFDLNALLGNGTRVQIPDVFSKWLTYALFTHVVGLILAAISAVFGLLAHIREMSMSCFSSCISGAAAFVTLVAFIFDLAVFFLARTRVRAIPGGSAEIGIAIWLTLVAWVLLFISGCMFGIGRCCIARRPGGPSRRKGAKEDPDEGNTNYGGGGFERGGNLTHAEQMRMDAVKAEQERKTRQASMTRRQEKGLPAFEEYEVETRPLTADDDYQQYRDNVSNHRPGYVPYNTPGVGTGAPRREPSNASMHSNNGQRNGYSAGGGGYGRNIYPPTSQTYGPGYRQQSLHSYNDLAEQDLYGPSATQGNNTYLQPGGTAFNRENSHHTQASSYHSAHSQQNYPATYTTTPNVDYNASRGEYDAYAQPVPVPPPQRSQTGNSQSYSQYPPQQAFGTTDPYGGPAGISRPQSSATDSTRPQRQQSTYSTSSSRSNYRQNDYADAPPLPVPNLYQHPTGTSVADEQAYGGYTTSPPQVPISLTPGTRPTPTMSPPQSRSPQSPASPRPNRLEPWREVTEPQDFNSHQTPAGPPPGYDDGPGPAYTSSSQPAYPREKY